MFTLALGLVLSAHTPAFACDDKESAEAGHSGEKKACPLPTAETTAAVPASGTHVALNVSGMHCGGCANSVHTALMAVPGVAGAQVDLQTGVVQVAYDAAKTTPDKLVAAVAALGEFSAKLATN